jgi:glucose/arabinose dehydrogenase
MKMKSSCESIPTYQSEIQKTRHHIQVGLAAVFAALCLHGPPRLQAQPSLVDSNLAVRTVVTNLQSPTTMAFLGRNDLLVLEKNSGKVLRVIDGVIQPVPALDLAVNNASERGLLGIALHPNFPRNPGVYLRWTESSTGADSDDLASVPLLGNRVDRFVWNGSTLTFDRNIIQLRAFQADAGQPLRGNHNGGIIRFGPDGKLYIYMGDNGRRGQMQNLPDGPGCTNPPCNGIPAGNLPDDQFGGPEPDNAHLTGVILRLNDDGSTPRNNPFFKAGELRGGEAGTNLQKVFAFGIRNGFGMSFDPYSGRLWEAQNGDDSFTEINLVEPGANLGWVQIMGPASRLDQFKEIETSSNFFGLQQLRWPPTNIADSPEEALGRLFWVFEGGDEFGALLRGNNEVPAVQTASRAFATFDLKKNGRLEFELRASGPITNATQAHIHLGAQGQNGPVVAFLFGLGTGSNFERGDLIGRGTLYDSNIIARPGFIPSVSNLVARMRQGRAYANLHTVDHPSGEIRGPILVLDERPVSHYSNPEFSWKYEVAPAGIGFIEGRMLGGKYRGDMIVGAARDFLQGGTLFHFDLTGGRREIKATDKRLRDKVADNLGKFEITESESLLFGTGFGVGTDIQTGPNGNLFVVSLTSGAIYEIYRSSHNDDDDNDDHGHGHGHDD